MYGGAGYAQPGANGAAAGASRSDGALDNNGRRRVKSENGVGGGAEQRLQREKGYRLDAGTAAVVLRQMLRSVLCCHAHGMAHRDLKPDNFVFQSTEAAAAA